MRSFENIKTVIKAGLGLMPVDLLIKNVRLVNVFSCEIYETNIHIIDGRIVSIEPGLELQAKKIIDGQGRFAVPGLIDTHMHFESTMLSPEALAEVMVPHGTTTVCADLMEIANVAGIEGLKALLVGIDKLPYRLVLEVPSRVPTAPGLETTGAILGAPEVAEIMAWDEAVSLGELDPSKILFLQDEYLHKITATLKQRKIVNGHAIGRLGQELNIYASAGIADDHECVTGEEMLARLRLGLRVLVREGSTERNLQELMTAVLEQKLDFDNLMFCTDDKHATEIRAEGHINYNVKKAIALGVAPLKALQMGTINAARHFRQDDEFGVIAPGRSADILLVDDLAQMMPAQVFFQGRLVAEGGRLTEASTPPVYPQWIRETMKLKAPVTPEQFQIKTKTTASLAEVNVIGLYDEQIINDWLVEKLPVENKLIMPDLEQNILKLAVVERYGKNGNVAAAFVKNFTLQKGALAYSMSHDHHNIVCVGLKDEDLALAANTVAKMGGGLAAVCDGWILSQMALPVGGIMSDKGAVEVMAGVEKMNQAARDLGCTIPAPFMTLSFISLPTVPSLGLTDLGLIDVLEHKLIAVEREPQ